MEKHTVNNLFLKVIMLNIYLELECGHWLKYLYLSDQVTNNCFFLKKVCG